MPRRKLGHQTVGKLYSKRGFFVPPLTNLQKAATCAWLFALLNGQVCAEGVHAVHCKNSKKWIMPLFRHDSALAKAGAFSFLAFYDTIREVLKQEE
ncbi:hypothetical protein DW094_00545 [Ruminococcaceae bacterium AM07-15]|nr:hypothetical protein DW094_00545 [Ruminococcaceae bacterium AM07-15]